MTIDVQEALRYLGAGAAADESLCGRMDALAETVMARCTPRWVWRAAEITRTDEGVVLSGVMLPGRTAARMLADCRIAVALTCTLGMDFEGWLRREQSRDMARAVMLDALGSAWVEAGCDAAEKEIAARFPGMHLTDRFSPGYGDLPLSIQPGLLDVTDARRRVGVYETESHLMMPQKSVTALIGIADRPQMARVRGCAFCQMKHTCTLRKVGKTCDV